MAVAAVVAAAVDAAARRRSRAFPTDAERQAGGFGVRVVHSGVWGFASSPIVTEDEIRRITRLATEVAKASAIAKKTDLKLAPVPAYVENYVTPMVKPPLERVGDGQAGVGAGDRRQGEGRSGRHRT